jgi:adenylate cyclase
MLLIAAIVLANITGAVVVFTFAVWVLPTPDVDDTTQATLVNLAVVCVYLAAALAIGISWGTRMLPLREQLVEERPTTARELRTVLHGPLRLAAVNATLWVAAAGLFSALNTLFSPTLALSVAITVTLGGVTTSAIAYLLSERLLRAVTARALASGPPERPAVPGILARSVLAWVVGTAVPVVGLVLVALFALAGRDISRDQLAVTILGLGGIALVVGLLVAVLAARAASDPVAAVSDAVGRVEQGDFDVEVPVYDGSEVGLLQAGFNRMVAGLRERERIRRTFGTYVDHKVAEHILEEGVSLEGEEVEVTLVFVDVRDFTGIAERLPPGEVVATLNELFDRAVPIVHEHEGHVDKFVGDGLLAVFGAPRRQPDHADEALAAALELARSHDGELDFGIGLNSGSVVAGNVGGGGRLEFSVIGDAVNVAARVEAATRETGDRILLTEATKERLSRVDVELEERPALELKGKSTHVNLYAVKLDRD